MKTSSAKAKGRRCSQEVKDLLLASSPDLQEADIVVTPSGVPGVDLHFSSKAQEKYPFVVECKNQEKLQIWSALEQAESHIKNSSTYIPVLFFRRNRSKLYVALEAKDFLKLHKECLKCSKHSQ